MKFYLGFIVSFCIMISSLRAEAQLQPAAGTPSVKSEKKSSVVSDAKEINELKTQLKEQSRKIDDLNKSLQQQNNSRQILEESLVHQRKLLLDEQQKLVEEIINKRRQLSTFVNENSRSSDRERILAQELEQSSKSESVAVKKVVDLRESQGQLEDINRSYKNLQIQLANAESEYTLTSSQKRDCEEKLKSLTVELQNQSSSQSNSITELAQRDNRIEQLQSELNQANQIVRALQAEVETKKQLEVRIQGLDRELTEARNLIMLKETELKILNESGAIPVNRVPDIRTNLSSQANQNTGAYNYPLQQRRVVPTVNPKPVNAADINSDVLVVTVIEDKVNLRSGPGNEHAPVMQVQRGSRLTVESRQGDWFSVITPTGSRAFVQKDFVTSGQVSSNPAKPVARTSALSSGNGNLNDEADTDEAKKAFEALRGGFAKP